MDFFEQMDRIYCQSFYLDSFEKILEQKTLFSRNLWKKHQQFQRFFQQNCILPPLLPPRANQVTTTTCSTTYSSSTIGIGNTSIEFSLQIICYWIEIQCVAKQKTIDVIAQFYPIKTTTDPMKLLNMTLFFVNSFLSSKMLQWIGQKFQHTLQKIIEQEFLLHLKLT
jgi:hypothetical protein